MRRLDPASKARRPPSKRREAFEKNATAKDGPRACVTCEGSGRCPCSSCAGTGVRQVRPEEVGEVTLEKGQAGRNVDPIYWIQQAGGILAREIEAGQPRAALETIEIARNFLDRLEDKLDPQASRKREERTGDPFARIGSRVERALENGTVLEPREPSRVLPPGLRPAEPTTLPELATAKRRLAFAAAESTETNSNPQEKSEG